MTPDQVALLADSRLSDAARVLGLHASMLPEGAHELPFDQLATLLHGTPNNDTVGRHMRQLVAFGYLERTSAGGKGSPRFRWSARENSSPESAMPAKIHGHKAPSSTTTNLLPTNGREAPSVENSPRPVPGARTEPPTPNELVPIREHLAEFAYAVDVFAGSVGGGSWPAAILGKYGPTGTRREFWKGVAADREPAILADAMLNYASDFPGKPYQAPLFESLLTRARDGAPVKPPKIIPGTEHAAVRSSYGAETPGDTRGLHRATVAVPERVLVNLRRNAEAKAGPDADPAVVDQLVAETAAAWEKNHGNGNGTRLSA